MEHLISVIVPVYNVEKYLDKCVESIVNQTYENLEIILVDDGSPDNCPAICDKWADRDSRITVIHKENGGVSAARNIGIDNATGEYITFVDSDDYIDSKMLTTMLDNQLKNNADICMCNFKRVDEDGNILFSVTHNECVYEDENVLIHYFQNPLFEPGCPAKLYNADIFSDKSVRFPLSVKIGEDYIFNFRALSKCKKIIYIPEDFYCYFSIRENSATSRYSRDMAMRWRNTRYLLDFIDDEKVLSAAINKYQQELLCCMRELLRSKNNALINECYKEIVDEIKVNSKDIINNKKQSRINKISVRFIKISPWLFKNLYKLFVMIK